MAKSPPSIAATSTLAMVRTAQTRGVRTEDLLAQAGLTLELLENPDARLPGPTILGLWNALRQRCADPALQLAAPATLPFGAYRVIDYLVAAAATVGEGIGHFVRFFGLIADAVALGVDQDRDGYCLCLSMAKGGPVPPLYVDYVFAALVSRIRMRIKPDLQVRQVEFRQPEPPARAPYADLFRAPVSFGADADRLFFSAEEWHSPTAGADAALAQVLQDTPGSSPGSSCLPPPASAPRCSKPSLPLPLQAGQPPRWRGRSISACAPCSGSWWKPVPPSGRSPTGSGASSPRAT